MKKARHDYEDADNSTAIANRRLLKETMESIGLKALPHEWWHYELPDGRTEKYPMIQN
ncbi:MAG: M15 family metallopeptidase [Alphaproteobacteria bacterium]